MEALKWHLLPERRSLVTTERTRPRKSTVGRVLAVGGMDAHKVFSQIMKICILIVITKNDYFFREQLA